MSYSIVDICFQDRAEAEKTLDTLKDLLGRFGSVRVIDYYEICDLPGNEKDKYYEWTDLRKAKVVRSSFSEGYFIDFSECPICENITTRGHMHLGNDDMADAFRYALPYINFRKENEKMTTPNIKNTHCVTDSLQAQINEIYDIYNLKMSQLEIEREQEIENLKKNYERDQAVEKIKEAAFRQKAKLDALIEAGFTKKEAMDMVMEGLRSK